MLFSTNSFKQLGNKIPSTTCVGSQVRFDYKRTTLPIACSLQMFVTISRVKSWIFIYFMLVIPGCKPKKHKIWIIHGDQGVGTAEIHHPSRPSCWNISRVNMIPGDRNPDLARRARKIQHQIVPIVAVVTACFTLSFRNYTFIIFIWNFLHIVTWKCTQFQHNSLLTGTAKLIKLCVCVTTPACSGIFCRTSGVLQVSIGISGSS